jgi:hypothetical protein
MFTQDLEVGCGSYIHHVCRLIVSACCNVLPVVRHAQKLFIFKSVGLLERVEISAHYVTHFC